MDGSNLRVMAPVGPPRLELHRSAATAGAAINPGGMLASLGFAALASIPLATVLVGRQGVAFANEAAERVLREGDGLKVCPRSGELAGVGLQEARRLASAIDEAQRGAASRLVPIVRQRIALPLLLSISPLRDELFGDRDDGSGFALVIIHDPAQGSTDSGRLVLTQLYGLTEAELGVATAILLGSNAKRIARARDVGLPTVRSQIRQVLAKTGCCTQRVFLSRFGWLGRAG